VFEKFVLRKTIERTESMKNILRYLGVLCLGYLGLAFPSHATHLKGGEITVRRISTTSLTFEFTLTTYTERNPANDQQDSVYFCFGDGGARFRAARINGPNRRGVQLPDGSILNIYRIVYTYQAPASFYRVRVAIRNRNANVLNINNSVNQSFYVETIFSINAGLGLNSTPVLLNPAVDITAVVGQRFIHNANAFDAEGDSLSYRLALSRVGDEERCNDGVTAPGFVQPNLIGNGRNEANTGPATFEINPITGDLRWDTPAQVGLYNCAFIVEEWRNGIKISETVRDMQIEVRDSDNRAPDINIPQNVCVEAGTLLNENVTAVDKPSRTGRIDPVVVRSVSALYATNSIGQPQTFIQPAFATFQTATGSSAQGTFRWQTGCQHIRQEGYDVLFVAEDLPLLPLVKLFDSKVWKVRVVAPRPSRPTAVFQAGSRRIVVTWDRYFCSATPNTELLVYRRTGSCSSQNFDPCNPNPLTGYTLVGRVAANQTRFEDNDPNLRSGVPYSYRLVAQFNNNTTLNESFSVASAESCVESPIVSSVITNVTVDQTSTTAGQITVRWTRPPVDTGLVRRPYEYRLLRTTGQTGQTFTEVTRIPTNLQAVPDTIFADRNLNTLDNSYRYRMDFYFTLNGTLTRYDSTTAASSVRLTAAPGLSRTVELRWQANVPWNNENQRHRVYRENRGRPGTFNLIAEVPVTNSGTFAYVDNGRDNATADGDVSLNISPDSLYCYRVETVGTYNSPRVRPNLLLNFSQVACSSARDTTSPCQPVLRIDALDCNLYTRDLGNCANPTFSNILNWTYPSTPNCDANRIVAYRIYYKRYEDESFVRVGEVTSPLPPATRFVHTTGLTSFAGYYVVTAVNRSGIESRPSNVVTNDNCPTFELPNVFTPNGDNRNDTFTPLRCPRFVRAVRLDIYNRDGQKVWEYNGTDPNIGWDGRSTSGGELPSGPYFYECVVIFDTLARDGRTQTLKGWIQILR
jgi:gliding motility-associated-like protein